MIELIKLTPESGVTGEKYAENGGVVMDWTLLGTPHKAQSGTPELCSPTVIHAYDSVLQAFIHNGNHANYARPRVFRIACPEIAVRDATKLGVVSATAIAEWTPEEVDAATGFCAWEAWHPVNPLAWMRDEALDYGALLRQWASVGASVRASVGASVWAYVGSLFPLITEWKYAENLGPTPWQPLRELWLGGYVPSFDGTLWRLHAGPNADVVYTMKPGGEA